MLAQSPLIGVDGKPLDLGAANFMLSDARMTKHFLHVQERNLAEMDKLNARLRKDFDAAKLGNKRKMKELQQITSELSQIERLVQSDRAEGGGVRDAALSELDVRLEEVQEDAQVRGRVRVRVCARLAQPRTAWAGCVSHSSHLRADGAAQHGDVHAHDDAAAAGNQGFGHGLGGADA